MSTAKLSRQKERTHIYESILNNVQNGVIITDPNGKIIFFSKTYANFLGIEPQEFIGKHCTEVLENTRMHIVAKTKIPEIDFIQRVKGHNMVVQRIPVEINGKVVAVYGQIMFKDLKELQNLAKKLDFLESKVEFYEKELESLRSSKYTINNIIGKSKNIIELKKSIIKVANTNMPILLIGESGTGKELFAHAIHHVSARRYYPFIRVNCAAIPKDLLETELFGYEPGAFTGAGSRTKPGKFELAHRGTIFLDEISELPMQMQPKLLRILEEKEIERLGGTRLTRLDFRLIAATQENLEECVSEGKFRKDLYYRLNVIPIQIPPLRERKEDILPIAEQIIEGLNRDLGTNIKKISPEVINIFQNYDWPGNVRELINILERIISFTDEDTLRTQNLPFFMLSKKREPIKTKSNFLKDLKENVEKEALLQALIKSEHNKNKAAKSLGINRITLYKKIKKFNIISKNHLICNQS
jgi:PAS domain S-box-containing protein